MNGFFACFGSKYLTFDTDNVTHVIFLEIGIGFFADAVARHIALHIALQILYITERRFTHNTFGHHTTCDGNRLAFQRIIIVFDFLTVMCHIIFCNLKRVFAAFLQCGKFFPPYFQKLVYVLNLLFVALILYFCHVITCTFLKCYRYVVFYFYISRNPRILPCIYALF